MNHTLAGISWVAHAVALRPAAPIPLTAAYALLVGGTPGLISWWRLDDPAPPPPLAIDSGPLLNTATSTGTTYGRPTAIVADPGAAVATAGLPTSFLSAPSDPAYDVTRISLEAWVNPSSVDGLQTIVRRQSQWGLRLFGSAANLFFFRVPGGCCAELNTAPGAIVPGRWQHVVGTYDGAETRLYVDGRLMATQAATFNIAGGSLGVAMGRRSTTSTGASNDL